MKQLKDKFYNPCDLYQRLPTTRGNSGMQSTRRKRTACIYNFTRLWSTQDGDEYGAENFHAKYFYKTVGFENTILRSFMRVQNICATNVAMIDERNDTTSRCVFITSGSFNPRRKWYDRISRVALNDSCNLFCL